MNKATSSRGQVAVYRKQAVGDRRAFVLTGTINLDQVSHTPPAWKRPELAIQELTRPLTAAEALAERLDREITAGTAKAGKLLRQLKWFRALGRKNYCRDTRREDGTTIRRGGKHPARKPENKDRFLVPARRLAAGC